MEKISEVTTSGASVAAMAPPSRPDPRYLRALTNALQQDLIEGLGPSPRLVTWPACPDHRRHPLWLRSAGRGAGHEQEPADDPVWTCPVTNRAVADLGQL